MRNEGHSTFTARCGMGGGSAEISQLAPAVPSGCLVELYSKIHLPVSDQAISNLWWCKSLSAWSHWVCPLFWFCWSHLLVLDSFSPRDCHSTHVGTGLSRSTLRSGSSASPFGTETTLPFPSNETSFAGWAAHAESLRCKGVFTLIAAVTPL